MTNIQALQELYVALGGELTDTYDDIANGIAVGNYTVKPDIIKAIAQLAGSAGIELPVIAKDGSDNSDVLMVVGNKWAKAQNPVQNIDLTGVTNASKSSELLTEIDNVSGDSVINFSFQVGDNTLYYNLPYTITWNEDDEAEQLDVYINTSTGITKKTYTAIGVTTTTASLTFE